LTPDLVDFGGPYPAFNMDQEAGVDSDLAELLADDAHVRCGCLGLDACATYLSSSLVTRNEFYPEQ
jgi:hypothetical protein